MWFVTIQPYYTMIYTYGWEFSPCWNGLAGFMAIRVLTKINSHTMGFVRGSRTEISFRNNPPPPAHKHHHHNEHLLWIDPVRHIWGTSFEGVDQGCCGGVSYESIDELWNNLNITATCVLMNRLPAVNNGNGGQSSIHRWQRAPIIWDNLVLFYVDHSMVLMLRCVQTNSVRLWKSITWTDHSGSHADVTVRCGAHFPMWHIQGFISQWTSVDSLKMNTKYFWGAWQMQKRILNIIPISTPTLVLGGY